jgi:hypothetical protein
VRVPLSITERVIASACVFFFMYITVRIYFLEVCVFLYLLQSELLPLHAFFFIYLQCEFISLKCAFSLYDTERVYCLTVGVFLYILPSVFIAV